ncbi:MAG: class I SAM-dependent methyltransferase, partial [Anaerolineales bacterium]
MTLPPAVQAASSLDQEWVEVTACPICGSPVSRPFESVEMGAERVSYRLCGKCGAVFQSPRMSEEALENYYVSDYLSQHQRAEGVTEKELRVQAGRARHLIHLMRGDVGAVRRHLDIGSSTGKLMQAAATAYGCESVGVEPAEVYRAYSEAQGLRVYPELKAMLAANEPRFDLITMAHVLEHLPDPVGLLGDLSEQWLSSEGTLLVEVPNLFGHFSL